MGETPKSRLAMSRVKPNAPPVVSYFEVGCWGWLLE
jgi:hypothetical protein